MSSASGMVFDSTAAATFVLVSFWLIITTSMSILFCLPQSLMVLERRLFASSEKISPPQ